MRSTDKCIEVTIVARNGYGETSKQVFIYDFNTVEKSPEIPARSFIMKLFNNHLEKINTTFFKFFKSIGE